MVMLSRDYVYVHVCCWCDSAGQIGKSGSLEREMMRTSRLRLQSFLPWGYLALSHDHEHNN
jgi:hypothetical protein